MEANARELWTAWRKRRDARSFEALVRPLLPHAKDLARRAGCNDAEAEDLVQETLILLSREKSDDPVRVGVRAWVGRRIRLQARKQARSRTRRRRHEHASSLQRRNVQSTDPPLEVREEVESAFSLLKEVDRQTVVLRYLHDMDYREIAYVLGVSENACRLRVHKGIRRLRSVLGGHAAALVAALGLPAVRAEAAMLGKAAAASAGSTALTFSGAIIMTTKMKVAAAALIAAGATAVGMLAVGASFQERPVRTAPPEGRRASVTPPRTRKHALNELAPSADEIQFLREALVKERERREEARIRPEDSGLDILRRVLEHRADVTGLLSEYSRFRSHVRTGGGSVARVESTGDVTEVNLDEVGMGATVIEFGAGTFEVRGNKWRTLREDVKELEIRGAGMDRTTLLLGQGHLLMVLKDLEHLWIHDLTIDGAERRDELLDVRGRVAAILENVRLRRASWAMIVMGGAYLGCLNCEFLGGHRSRALSVRGSSVVLLKDCLLADWEGALLGWSGAAAQSVVHFDGCTFENTKLTDSRFVHQGRPEFPIRVSGGRVLYGAPDLPEEKRREKWGAVHAAQVAQVIFAPRVARCTVADLLRVLDLAQPQAGEILAGVQLAVLDRAKAADFDLFFLDPQRSVRRMFVSYKDGRLVERPADRSRSRGLASAQQLAATLPIAELLRRANVPLTLEAHSAVLQIMSYHGETVPSLAVGEGWPPPYRIHGLTGEVIGGR